MATLARYGAYVPQYRAPLGEIQRFEGRPGRPRAAALATPGLDEDPLTMAWEAATQALDGEKAPAALITVTHSSPFGLRKLSQTLARALDLPDHLTCYDLAGHPGSLVDALELAQTLTDAGKGPVLVVATDHIVSYGDAVCDILSAGGAAAFLVKKTGGFAKLGEVGRHGNEIYDLWRLGTEAEVRYRNEVLFDGYGKGAAGAFAALEKATGRETGKYSAICPSQPHPNALKGIGKSGVTPKQLANTSFVANIGNLGTASAGVALALALDKARKGNALAVFGYGGGEGIAMSLELTATAPKIGLAAKLEDTTPIDLGTYYRWTRGRQQQPH